MGLDSLGYRRLFGVLGPSTNTTVQPDYDDMRPPGVTNHYSRIFTPNAKAISNETFYAGTMKISEGVLDAVRSVMTCEPDYLVMGMSAITFYGGAKGAEKFTNMVEKEAGVKVSVGSTSCVEALKAYGGMLEVASLIQTGSGADMNFPTADATAEVGEIVGQNSAATGLDTAFGNTVLSVYKYSSKKIALPWELVQDSFLDIEAYIQGVLAVRLGRITNTHFTTGTGSGQPRGVVTGAALGKTGTTGQTATVIYDDLVDLEHSVNRAYRRSPGCGWMMADSSLKVVRKIKDGQSRPIFVPGYETGVPGGAPDTLMGRAITINDDVATMAANAKSILFGDFRKYVIRRVMDLTMFRMTDSAFTLNGQVGFVAFQRVGGNLVDAGGSVKYYANSAT